MGAGLAAEAEAAETGSMGRAGVGLWAADAGVRTTSIPPGGLEPGPGLAPGLERGLGMAIPLELELALELGLELGLALPLEVAPGLANTGELREPLAMSEPQLAALIRLPAGVLVMHLAWAARKSAVGYWIQRSSFPLALLE